MRPLHLRISAFGPFASDVNIDFSKFGRNNIVLISGDTGSGKTTIFDAITYALFSKTSGDIKGVDMLRSDFASDGKETVVELIFEYRETEYKVIRIPRQRRAKKKGEGYTERASEVYLYKEGELISSATKEVDKTIEEILGINYDQYKQIAMLAQGDFIKLIHAPTDTRSKIFRKIFNTKVYENLENSLKEKKKNLYTQYNNKKQKIDEIINISRKRDGSFIHSDDLSIIENMKRIEEYNNYLVNIKEQLDERYTFFDAQKNKMSKDLVLSERINADINEFEIVNDELKKMKRKEQYYKELSDSLIKSDRSNQCHQVALDIKEHEHVLNDLYIELDKNQDELAKKTRELTSVSKDFVIIDKERENITDFSIKRRELEERKNALDELSIKEKERLDKIELLSEEKEMFSVLERSLKEYQEKLANLKDHLISEIDLREKDNSLKEIILRLESDEKITNQIGEQEGRYKDLLATESILRDKLLSLKALLEKSKKEYSKSLKSFLRSSAYALSESLVEGEPCPVCGSKNHPKPYVDQGTEFSENDLSNAKDIYDNKQKEVYQCENELKSTLKDIEVTKALIKSLTSELTFDDVSAAKADYLAQQEEFDHLLILQNEKEKTIAEVSDLIEGIKDKKLECEKRIIKTEEIVKGFDEQIKVLTNKSSNASIEEIEKNIVELSNRIENINIKYTEMKELKEVIFEEKTLINNKIITIESSVHTVKNTLKNLKKELKRRKKEYDLDDDYVNYIITKEEYDVLNKDLSDYNESKLRIIARYNILSDKTKGKKKADIEKIKSTVDVVSRRIEKVKHTMDNNHLVLNQNENVLKRLRELSVEFSKLESTYSIYDDLSRVMSGQLVGKDRLSIERYVQQIYFDDIIDRANKRFFSMTDSRYELLRKVNGYKGAKQIGLDLDVIDNYTNAIRDVKTLSGGESFKAALSLALGLSDVIKEYSGGIRIDTMFIDEGFGTLDEESLDKAIHILSDLSQNDMLIGIISHVRELRNRIDKKIIVEKSANGSTISTII